MGVVVDPFARCRNPLACRDSGGVADDRDQIAMARAFRPQNAEAVLAIMEGDTLDQACQYFLGRWFLLWPHLCCRCWRQSPNRIWRPALRSRSSSATRCPRVLSIGDRPVVGNRPAIQILGSLEAACDDGATAAVGLITQGRPADSFGLSERFLLGDRILLMSPRLVHVQTEFPIRTPGGAKAISQRSRRVAETRFDRTAGGSQFEPYYLHHPVFRYRTPRVIRAFVP